MTKRNITILKIGIITIFLCLVILGIFLFIHFNRKNNFDINIYIDGELFYVTPYDKNFVLPTPPDLAGANFVGWYLDENFTKKIDDAKDIKTLYNSKDKAIYAKYDYYKIVINFIVDGVVKESLVIDKVDDFYLLDTPIKENAKFLGWFLGDIRIDNFNFKNNLNIFAKYNLQAFFCFHEYFQQFNTATCEQYGESFKRCLRCEEEIDNKPVKAFGHTAKSQVDFNDFEHFNYCERYQQCGKKFNIQPHIFNDYVNYDYCSGCNHITIEAPIEGSAISKEQMVAREKITDFSNIPNKPNVKGTLDMITINIGQGDCIFIKFPDGKSMVMDSGSAFGTSNNYYRLEEILTQYKILTLDYLFITHSDYDHIRYVEKLLKNFNVKNVYIPRVSDDHKGSTYQDTITAISKATYVENNTIQKTKVRYNIHDFQIAGKSWRMKCYSYLKNDYPTINKDKTFSPTIPNVKDTGDIINSVSPICLLEYAGRTIVLTGDSNQYNETYLVNRGVFFGVDADVLKVAHHGSKTSTTANFLASVKCEYALISHGGMYGHPTEEVLQRLDDFGYKAIYETKGDGNIKVSVSYNGTLNIDAQNSVNKDISDKLYMFRLSTIEEYCLNYSNKEDISIVIDLIA